jgi:hypothetical protein
MRQPYADTRFSAYRFQRRAVRPLTDVPCGARESPWLSCALVTMWSSVISAEAPVTPIPFECAAARVPSERAGLPITIPFLNVPVAVEAQARPWLARKRLRRGSLIPVLPSSGYQTSGNSLYRVSAA